MTMLALAAAGATIVAAVVVTSCSNDGSASRGATTPAPVRQQPTTPATQGDEAVTDPDGDFFNVELLHGMSPVDLTDTSKAVPITIAGERFDLVPALDTGARTLGLGGVASIPDRGGMVFVFPAPTVLSFVMRDCRTDIDIAYLDDRGRVLTTYTMINEPRRPGESDWDYEDRLTRYSSRFPARFAVEVAPGTFERLGVRTGDVFEFDAAALKARAR